jgi:hypothetical protein
LSIQPETALFVEGLHVADFLRGLSFRSVIANESAGVSSKPSTIPNLKVFEVAPVHAHATDASDSCDDWFDLVSERVFYEVYFCR